jgi:hypothetical protein
VGQMIPKSGQRNPKAEAIGGSPNFLNILKSLFISAL